MATDRRRLAGPAAETNPPIYTSYLTDKPTTPRPTRSRAPDELRKIFLTTSLTPSASGSAYLELLHSPPSTTTITHQPSLIPTPSTPKITVSIHGPRPLPRSAPFSPHLLLTTSVHFAPFALRHPLRVRGARDAVERDIASHLEAALRGVVIGERWPKSGVEVCVTVLEGEEGAWWGDGADGGGGGGGAGDWGAMAVLAGCITAASAALVEAGIDCVDMVTGGVAAVVRDEKGEGTMVVLDPSPSEHNEMLAACVVGYLQSRDEITEVWLKGAVGDLKLGATELVDRAVDAAIAARSVLEDVVREAAQLKFASGGADGGEYVQMT